VIEFQTGQWVWLRLLHRPTTSLDIKGKGKLGPKFYWLFKIMERVGNIVYRLQLLAGAKIHDVFHVDLLKKFCEEPPEESGTLPPIRHVQN
jgi:hypothetical protein